MFIQIGSNKFNVLKLYKSANDYTVRISKDFENEVTEALTGSEDVTIQDGETSYVLNEYELRSKMIWEMFIDYTLAFETNPTVITKTELDAMYEQITNLELALCEVYENQEV